MRTAGQVEKHLQGSNKPSVGGDTKGAAAETAQTSPENLVAVGYAERPAAAAAAAGRGRGAAANYTGRYTAYHGLCTGEAHWLGGQHTGQTHARRQKDIKQRQPRDRQQKEAEEIDRKEILTHIYIYICIYIWWLHRGSFPPERSGGWAILIQNYGFKN